eukprot:GDKK01030199.1.p1 GENE.GDKK01030199.1~~GDKK01030199.1.p1  ORF type:complete len:251 (+),score=19.42 GDKK01030199.1:48-800(+)
MSDYRARLVRFFEKHNPEKLSTVDAILTKYQGKEPELFVALVSKYGPEPPAAENGFRARLVRFFEHHNKEKLSDVDTILTKYQGREADLFKALVGQYGPEPAEGSPTAPSPTASPPSSPARAPATTSGDYRPRIVRFFEKHNPEKLADVDTLLTKYQGREADLMKALVGKYGPEPSEASSAVPLPKPSPTESPQIAPNTSPEKSARSVPAKAEITDPFEYLTSRGVSLESAITIFTDQQLKAALRTMLQA